MMLILLYSYSFEMAIDQKMRNILQRHRIWKVSILFELTLDTFFPRFGAPSTLRLNILILVSALIIVDLQVFRSTAYAAVVLEIWASTSAIDFQSVVSYFLSRQILWPLQYLYHLEL